MKLYLTVLIVFVVASACNVASACSCRGYDSISDNIEKTEVLYLATPTRTYFIPLKHGNALTALDVHKAYKGEAVEKAYIAHSIDSATCGVFFDTGVKQLVFAYKSKNGQIGSVSCLRGSYSEKAILKYLETGEDISSQTWRCIRQTAEARAKTKGYANEYFNIDDDCIDNKEFLESKYPEYIQEEETSLIEFLIWMNEFEKSNEEK